MKIIKKPACVLLGCIALSTTLYAEEKPNIVFILCDDLGYGEIQALNPEGGKVLTPHVDSLAADGMIFSDAHTGSSVCTPTRYGLMTGRYSWRTKLQSGVVLGFAQNLIAEDRPTVASFMKAQGYHTGIVGKWHLNFHYQDPTTKINLKKPGRSDLAPVGSIIPDGPLTRGFDYYHGFHHAANMKCVIENDKVIAHDDAINMLPRITNKAVQYIAARAVDKKPFFLYVPYGSPHTPILPTAEWKGKSGLNDHADFVMQTDDGVGQIMAALRKHDLAENTIFIFSSDNGTSKAGNVKELAKKGHIVSAGFRGLKSDLWEGGHRVPFIVRWPAKVTAGSESDQLICLTDFFATLSDLTGADLPAASAEDSVSFLPALSGEPIESTRAGVIHHSISGHFAYRQGKWKLLLARGSGGWSSPNEKSAAKNAPKSQLYDIDNDPAETTNLYNANPEIVQTLLAQLESDVTRGRSTDGAQSKNDIETINLWKKHKKK